jgi:hypothetical protein
MDRLSEKYIKRYFGSTESLHIVTIDEWLDGLEQGYIGMQDGNIKLLYLKIKGTDKVKRITDEFQSEVKIERLRKDLKHDGNREARTCYLFPRSRLANDQNMVRRIVQRLYPMAPDENIVKTFDTTSEFDVTQI